MQRKVLNSTGNNPPAFFHILTMDTLVIIQITNLQACINLYKKKHFRRLNTLVFKHQILYRIINKRSIIIPFSLLPFPQKNCVQGKFSKLMLIGNGGRILHHWPSMSNLTCDVSYIPKEKNILLIQLQQDMFVFVQRPLFLYRK